MSSPADGAARDRNSRADSSEQASVHGSPRLAAALALAALGWPVFPVYEPVFAAEDVSATCSCGNAGCRHPGRRSPKPCRGHPRPAVTNLAMPWPGMRRRVQLESAPHLWCPNCANIGARGAHPGMQRRSPRGRGLGRNVAWGQELARSGACGAACRGSRGSRIRT